MDELQGVGQGQAARERYRIHAKGSGTWRKIRGQARAVCRPDAPVFLKNGHETGRVYSSCMPHRPCGSLVFFEKCLIQTGKKPVVPCPTPLSACAKNTIISCGN